MIKHKDKKMSVECSKCCVSTYYENGSYEEIMARNGYVSVRVQDGVIPALCPKCQENTKVSEIKELQELTHTSKWVPPVSNGIKIDWKTPPTMTCTVRITCPSSNPVLPLKDENWVPSYPNEIPETVLPIAYKGEPLSVKLFEDASENDSDYVKYSKYLKTTDFVV